MGVYIEHIPPLLFKGGYFTYICTAISHKIHTSTLLYTLARAYICYIYFLTHEGEGFPWMKL